jgi:hypothetical protein
MATRKTSTSTDLGQGEVLPPPWEGTEPHEVKGIHGHAGYPSVEDLEARLAAARGEPTQPQLAEQLPAPDPSGAV